MGIYDLPACFNYIAELTGVTQINYMGHSQGTMQLFAAMTIMPEYFEKRIKSFVALAPVTELSTIKSQRLRLALDNGIVNAISKYMHEAFTVPQVSGNIISVLCNFLMPICSNVFRMFSDTNISDMHEEEKERFFNYISRLPSSTSVKAFNHFEMIYKSKSFIHYDYGDKNKYIYGQDEPFEYKLEDIKNYKICIIIGHLDKLSTIASSKNLHNSLKVKNEIHYHEYDYMGHHTFFFSEKFDWFKDVVNFLEKLR